MSKRKMKQFRLDEETLKKLEVIQEHLQDIYDSQSEEFSIPVPTVSNTKALIYAINFTYNELKEQGYTLFQDEKE